MLHNVFWIKLDFSCKVFSSAGIKLPSQDNVRCFTMIPITKWNLEVAQLCLKGLFFRCDIKAHVFILLVSFYMTLGFCCSVSFLFHLIFFKQGGQIVLTLFR